MSSRKRKHTRRGSPDYNAGGESYSSQVSSSNVLYVQAHEATIIRDRPDVTQALTIRDHGGGKGGLIQWHGEGPEGQREIWVDRYDARLLLTTIPAASRVDSPSSPPSPTGWSDLPSDSEDTFFFNPEEIEDYRREKRRKLMDAGREQRLRALQDSEPDPVQNIEHEKELWGGDEEEPEDTQRTLMERTAKHLLTSPNPGQLEMRILANHASDRRFAFLRGRWRNAWETIKLVAKAEKDEPEQKPKATAERPGAGLVEYGDSDSSDTDGPKQISQHHIDDLQKDTVVKEVDEKEKEARRARAREWAKQRKESKGIKD